MRKENTLSALVLCVVLFALACCAAEGANAAAKRATISPILVTLEPGASQRFAVEIAGRPARGVKWFVNDVPGGNAELGTITREGVYRAPAKPPRLNEVHVQAVVQGADNRYLCSTVLVGRSLPTYTLVARWGEHGEGKGQFTDPHGIALDRDGNLLVTDTVAVHVYRFTPEGKLLGEVGDGPASFRGPREVLVDAHGNTYVLDGTDIRILKFAPSGELLASWGEKGSGPGQMSRPHGFALGKDGRTYVADVDNNRVVVYGGDGRFLFEWGQYGTAPGQFNAPHAVATDRNGDVFVVEFHGRCQKFTADGQPLFTFAEEPGTYHSMTSDRWGDVYLMARSPSFGASIVKYNNNGAFVTRFRLPLKGEEAFYPKCAVVDDQGRLYLTESGLNNTAITILSPE